MENMLANAIPCGTFNFGNWGQKGFIIKIIKRIEALQVSCGCLDGSNFKKMRSFTFHKL